MEDTMETILNKIAWTVLALAGGFLIWAIKGLVKIIWDNREMTKSNYFTNGIHTKAIEDLKTSIEVHENRIDKNEKDINTIVITNNANNCTKHPKITI